MSLFDHNELFHQSGPQGMLGYLQIKLEAGDLSSEEALALLSALHEELGRAKAADPHVYQAYSQFMDSLQKAMPEVHAYVLSTWGHVHKQHENEAVPEVTDEARQDESTSRVSGSETKKEIEEAGISNWQESREEQEFGEAERPDSEGVEEEGAKEESIRGEAEETEETEAEESEEEDHEEEEESEPEVVVEPQEVEDSGREQSEESQEAEEPERDADESKGEEETEGEVEELEAKSEISEAEPEIEAGGHEGAEWPQLEEPDEEEPIEGEEGGPSPVD